MTLIDTHCHIHDPEYNFDPAQTLSRAHAAGVKKIIVIGTSPSDSLLARNFALHHPGVYWSLGHHPGECKDLADLPSAFSKPLSLDSRRLEKATRKSAGGPVAIGEIGLDYHYTPYDKKAQITLLEHYLDLSKTLNLPVIFHVREAFSDFWPVIDNAKIKNAVLHSFSDTQENLKIALEHNFLIGINGLATFTPLPLPPLENIILETDAPYLTPIPFRGKINEPTYIPAIAKWVAQKYEITLEKVAEITTQNAKRLFHI